MNITNVGPSTNWSKCILSGRQVFCLSLQTPKGPRYFCSLYRGRKARFRLSGKSIFGRSDSPVRTVCLRVKKEKETGEQDEKFGLLKNQSSHFTGVSVWRYPFRHGLVGRGTDEGGTRRGDGWESPFTTETTYLKNWTYYINVSPLVPLFCILPLTLRPPLLPFRKGLSEPGWIYCFLTLSRSSHTPPF